MKIAIAGIGGVGGYFGGLLAEQFLHSKDVEIYFIQEAKMERYSTERLTALYFR